MFTLAQAAVPASQDTPPAEETSKNADDMITRVLEGDPDTLIQLATTYALPLLWAIIIIVGAMIVAKMLSGMLRRSLSKAKMDETLSRFFAKMLFYVVVLLGVIFALSMFGIDVTAFAAVIAAAGFAVGMALSGTLSNFAAGVMLLIFRPYKVSDVINAAGVFGKVDEIELFTTTIDSFDNRRYIVPNGKLFGDTIENISFHTERRLDVGVGCDYSACLDKTREVLEKAAESLSEKMIQGEGRGYQIVLGDLGDSSVNWTVRFWCKADDYWPMKEALTRAVKQHLDEAGIGIPFPQMDVHVDGKMG